MSGTTPYGPDSLPLFFRDNDGEYMTDIELRDLFAGMAMSALVMDTRAVAADGTTLVTDHRPDQIASFAYKFADAMLEERSK